MGLDVSSTRHSSRAEDAKGNDIYGIDKVAIQVKTGKQRALSVKRETDRHMLNFPGRLSIVIHRPVPYANNHDDDRCWINGKPATISGMLEIIISLSR